MLELIRRDKESRAGSTPSASVTSVRAVVRDGWYNAFTDMICWRNYYWLSYRRGTCHHADHGVVVVLHSNDLRRWSEAGVFDRPRGITGEVDSGVQDGHFTAAGDRLYISINTRIPTDMFVSWTDDGVNWSEPVPMRMGDANPFIWRVRWHEGKFYSAVSYDGSSPLDLIVSDDGVEWTRHARIASSEQHDWSS